ncbi:MAG: serine acetyltransferase [Spirochaetaceae bacterium]|nr:serine acetyltransferase [Spirochaetaceae bacterium]
MNQSRQLKEQENARYWERWNAVSADVPEWKRECGKRYWEPDKRLIKTIRSYQYWKKKTFFISGIMRRISVLRYRFWTIATGADIPLNTTIGGGLLLTHPNGIVIHPQAVIGVNCLLFQQVTLGFGGKKPGAPVLGGHVDVGAGAKILGGVSIGNHVRIGANAVVLDDVPDYCTAVGIPARIIPIDKKNITHFESGNQETIPE